jgi:hypothetical protein
VHLKDAMGRPFFFAAAPIHSMFANSRHAGETTSYRVAMSNHSVPVHKTHALERL